MTCFEKQPVLSSGGYPSLYENYPKIVAHKWTICIEHITSIIDLAAIHFMAHVCS